MKVFQNKILIYSDSCDSLSEYEKFFGNSDINIDINFFKDKTFSELIKKDYELILLDGTCDFVFECLIYFKNLDAKLLSLKNVIICSQYCKKINELIHTINEPNIEFVIRPCSFEYIMSKIYFYSSIRSSKLEEAYQELDSLKRKLEMREKGIKKTDEAIKILYGEILKSNEIAANAIKCKSDFLTNMSHEIRTPLNAITGMIHLAMQLELPPKLSEYLKKIDNAGKLLLNIVNDILDFSKIEAGKLSIESVDFNLNEIFENLSNVIMCKASEKKDIEVNFEIEPDINPYLIGDPLRIEQILVNLANNAIKFTDSGSININAKIVNEGKKNIKILFSIQDTGIGITKEQQEKLFDAFVQADSSTTRKYGGTGLGLSICKQLVELMGGKISVDSKYGEGSCFKFELSLEKQTRKKSFNKEKNETLESIDGAEILLVEDNSINQEIAVSILQSNNLNVTVANNGCEAVEFVQSNKFDIILMDIQMPVMDGLEATQIIRESKSEIPIIGMTAHAFLNYKEECLNKGMNDYITKPIQVNSLYKVLLKWIPEKKFDVNQIANKHRSDDAGHIKDLIEINVEGIDTASGICRIGGNNSLYISLLKKFLNEYANLGSKLVDAVNSNTISSIESIAHSIAGVAGNLGAYELSSSALELEHALKSNEKKEFNTSLEDFYKKLDFVLNGIKTFLDNDDYIKEKSDIIKKKANGSLKFLRERILELEQHLKKRTPKPCKAIVENIEQYLWTDVISDKTKNLKEFVVKYKFKDAELALKNLIDSVNEEIEMENKDD